MSIALLTIAIIVLAATIFFLLKGKSPVMVLLFAGVILAVFSLIFDPSLQLLKEDATSGSRWFDIFGLIESVAIKQLSGVGIIIMAAGGFSAYMNGIGATDALVRIAARPLSKLGHPYMLLIVAYLLGQALFMVIPSAAGLALLLLVSIFPILVAAGVTPAAAGAVIVSCSALPMGPGTGTAILAAKTVGESPAVYFVHHQLPVALPTMIVIALILYITSKHFDRRDAGNSELLGSSSITGTSPATTATASTTPQTGTATASTKDGAPAIYAIFVLLPIILLIVFSPLTNSSIELSTVSAFFLVWILAIVVDLIRTRKVERTLTTAVTFFTGMGKMFGSVVSLIIAAQVFAEGLKSAGLIDAIINIAKGASLGETLMAIVLTIIVGAVTFLTGSGVGAFSAFASLAPEVATGIGASAVKLVTPMQFAGGLFRSMSPVAGVTIAVAGGVGISPVALARRSAPAMLGGILVMTALSLIIG
ncbi:MAG: C4-dicarboxylate transporter DcuC [Actinomycetaceae bacterium]|nr:C4-dicarboxylate transporter DcuC [Arcanobacterium sp.]MDD7687117.1 C4-dicarboxylate transporter DcuC [Actinomycetaceae bacterium]MDY5273218.1 C4-dicarboxylate transporter DcuC [Arcanobacterium sp.]